MRIRAAKDELDHLAEFQIRHRSSLLCVVCTELMDLTRIRSELGDSGALRLFHQHDQSLRDVLTRFPGALEVSSGNGAFFLVFETASEAVRFALELLERNRILSRKSGRKLDERIGIHIGEVLVETEADGHRIRDLNGLQVDICQALLSLAGPGRILLTRFAFDNAHQSLRSLDIPTRAGLAWQNHGFYRIEGIEEPIEIGEVALETRAALLPPKGTERIKQVTLHGEASGLVQDLSGTTLGQRVLTAPAQERRSAILGGVIAGFLGLLALMSGWFDGISYDLAYLFHRTEIPSEVVIVGIEDDDFKAFGIRRREFWNRSLHAALIQRLTRAKARAVGFDILFDIPTASHLKTNRIVAPEDQLFLDALRQNERVVLAGKSESEPDSPRDGASAWFTETRFAPPSPLFRSDGECPFQPRPNWGPVEWAPSYSSVIRNPAAELDQFPDVPTFVSALAKASHGREFHRPADAWLHYYGPSRTLRCISYSDALSPHTSDTNFTDRVVLVGSLAKVPPQRDMFLSPYRFSRNPNIAGVEVIATSYLNLVRGDWLVRGSVWFESLLTVGFGFLFGFSIYFIEASRTIRWASLMALGMGLLLMSQQWFTQHWFPWLVLSGVQVPFAASWALTFRTRRLTEDGRQMREILKKRIAFGTQTIPQSTPQDQGSHPGADSDSTAIGVGGNDGQTSRLRIPDMDLLHCIGKGAYGEVWLAKDLVDTYKAVKIIRRSAFADRAPYDREFRGLQKFAPISRSHPGLTHVLHIGRDEQDLFIYYVMEAGDDVISGPVIDHDRYLAHTLISEIKTRGPMDIHRVIRCGIEITDALAYLHGHDLIHRDIKPANILFVNGRAKLADIGLVTSVAMPNQEVTLIGTPGYMPPEGHGTRSSDVFSVGKLLYVALTGQSVDCFPKLGDSATRGGGGALITEFFDTIIIRACEPVVSDRYPNADALLEDLKQFNERISRASEDAKL